MNLPLPPPPPPPPPRRPNKVMTKSTRERGLWRLRLITAGGISLLALVFIAHEWGSAGTVSSGTSSPDKLLYKASNLADCKSKLKARLKDPSSLQINGIKNRVYDDPLAQASMWDQDYLRKYPREHKYLVNPHDAYVSIDYTARNGFGGASRDDFSCTYLRDTLITIDGKRIWDVTDDLELIPPQE